jgi:hypothetical protein
MYLTLVTAALGAQAGLTQLAVAGSMLKMNTQNARVGGQADRRRAAKYEFSRQRGSRRWNEARYHGLA